jgi:hypothetical protein
MLKLVLGLGHGAQRWRLLLPIGGKGLRTREPSAGWKNTGWASYGMCGA